ncbi:trypsin-like serine peptidase [Streptantibioticus parmotrematis]|uniref:trypsin-like serine peptidase n=1 Tax=Streptantibioticus parmotrematis TaxID=2873249 RepID=UPI00207BD975|nr:trypsin-like serine protease [Streptantibioticus parmotrematis]
MGVHATGTGPRARRLRVVAAGALLAGAALLSSCALGGPADTSDAFGTWSAQRLRRATADIHTPHGMSYTPVPRVGNARIGALFDHDASGDHFCSASVVHSPGKDLVLTAAHCIHGGQGSGYRKDIVFVPSYRDGAAPNGTWRVSALVVDPRWTKTSDPDLDVGFVILRPLHGRHVEDVLGADNLGVNTPFGRPVRLTGYPSSGQEPISCVNTTIRQSARQLRVNCVGFPGGTSGSPWLTGYDPAAGTGTVIGVIGGFQEGGDTADVSYSPYFGADVRKLYERAVALDGGGKKR